MHCSSDLLAAAAAALVKQGLIFERRAATDEHRDQRRHGAESCTNTSFGIRRTLHSQKVWVGYIG